MEVLELWRYPIKSFGGEQLRSATIEADGLRGDHLWAVVDATTGAVATAKKGAWSRLLECRARLLDDTDPTDPAALEVTLPGDRVFHGDDPKLVPALSEFTGRELTLERRPRSYDLAPLHVLNTAGVDVLATGEPTDVALRRFRPNIVVTGGTSFAENHWLGSILRIGGITVRPTQRTGRCVMVTLTHQEVPAVRDMLRTVTKHNAVPVTDADDRQAPCLGIYADVTTPGAVSVGDLVRLG
ncbi:MOSC domain-containing protein [Rhodococcus chondri]|uniref:MOSC domain-containing protein n=1 Tax=Rhodococcus chondri TaxID=3065941 RepID=A0ABU7JPZ3_9NOCA|nr:MOSC domain-containing protein [Rhodococcus sp. CC-R104]MEE2032102.1 MOSC domain-containing protein [Rhodococcus sp. CC-R104]